MKPARSEARKHTASAMSRAVPKRRSGMLPRAAASARSSSSPERMSRSRHPVGQHARTDAVDADAEAALLGRQPAHQLPRSPPSAPPTARRARGTATSPPWSPPRRLPRLLRRCGSTGATALKNAAASPRNCAANCAGVTRLRCTHRDVRAGRVDDGVHRAEVADDRLDDRGTRRARRPDRVGSRVPAGVGSSSASSARARRCGRSARTDCRVRRAAPAIAAPSPPLAPSTTAAPGRSVNSRHQRLPR